MCVTPAYNASDCVRRFVHVGRFNVVLYRQCDDMMRVQKEWSCVQCYDYVIWSSVRETFSPRDEEEKHNNIQQYNNVRGYCKKNTSLSEYTRKYIMYNNIMWVPAAAYHAIYCI